MKTETVGISKRSANDTAKCWNATITSSGTGDTISCGFKGSFATITRRRRGIRSSPPWRIILTNIAISAAPTSCWRSSPAASKQGEDGEISEDGAIEVIELPDSAEEAYLTASRTIAAAKAADAPAVRESAREIHAAPRAGFAPRAAAQQPQGNDEGNGKAGEPARESRKPSGKGDHGARPRAARRGPRPAA